MATVNFQIVGKTDKANIYLYVSVKRGQVFKKNTGYTINKNDWSKANNRPKQTIAELKKLKTSLDILETTIYTNINEAIEKNEIITGDWLQKQINIVQGNYIIEKSNTNLLLQYIIQYIENAPYHAKKNGEIGLAKNTLKKYFNLKNNIEAYEKHKKTCVRICEVNHVFQNDFVKFLEKEKQYSINNIGTIIKTLKSICFDAQKKGIETNKQLDLLKGFKKKIDKIILTPEEQEQIKNTTFTREALENAKDWLLIGCYLGQRVSDLLKLTTDNITIVSGSELITLEQQKTRKRVVIPLFPEVKEILNKRNGEFPYAISDQRFNEYIKDVVKLSGIDTPTKGAKMNPETKRKENGIFPKWELVTSHICRRSFATNYYGEIPTPLLMSVTGHSTETQFLEYIGKTSTEQAIQLAEYWTQGILKAQKKPVLTVIKKAN